MGIGLWPFDGLCDAIKEYKREKSLPYSPMRIGELSNITNSQLPEGQNHLRVELVGTIVRKSIDTKSEYSNLWPFDLIGFAYEIGDGATSIEVGEPGPLTGIRGLVKYLKRHAGDNALVRGRYYPKDGRFIKDSLKTWN